MAIKRTRIFGNDFAIFGVGLGPKVAIAANTRLLRESPCDV